MPSAPYDLSISATRAGALFASPLRRTDEPRARQVRRAIATATGVHGVRGCAARVAQAYGEHPPDPAHPDAPGAHAGGQRLQVPAPRHTPAHGDRPQARVRTRRRRTLPATGPASASPRDLASRRALVTPGYRPRSGHAPAHREYRRRQP
jgi:hypothetical protein